MTTEELVCELVRRDAAVRICVLTGTELAARTQLKAAAAMLREMNHRPEQDIVKEQVDRLWVRGAPPGHQPTLRVVSFLSTQLMGSRFDVLAVEQFFWTKMRENPKNGMPWFRANALGRVTTQGGRVLYESLESGYTLPRAR